MSKIPYFLGQSWIAFLFERHSKGSQYTELNVDRILKTLETLQLRIQERFPGSGLGQVNNELLQVAGNVRNLVEHLRRPIWPVRLVVMVGIVLVVALAAGAVHMSLRISPQINGISDWLQGLESATNELIFLAIALFFLGSLENRLKRFVALRALHRLRSIAHVVDMHQLTKDPAHLLQVENSRVFIPDRSMTPYELTRYLDYCSELLSIVSKLAALHVQYLNDPVVLNAVNDLENLAHGLSNKIWQKIMILDIATPMQDKKDLSEEQKTM